MNKISKWLNANKLSINTIKTKFMLYRTLKKTKTQYDIFNKRTNNEAS